MKSVYRLFLILVLAGLLATPALAQVPTPTPTIAEPENIVAAPNGATSQPLVFPEVVSFLLKNSFFQKIFTGFFRPKEVKVTDLNKESITLTNSVINLLPMDLQASITPAPPDKFITTGKFRICVKDPKTGEMKSKEADSYYRSGPNSDYSLMAQSGSMLSAITMPSDAISQLDFSKTYDTTEVIDKTGDCGSTDQAIAKEEKALPAIGQSLFGSNPLTITGVITAVIRALFPNSDTGNVTLDSYGQTTQTVSHGTDIAKKTVGSGSRQNGFVNVFFDSIQDPTKGNTNAQMNNDFDYQFSPPGSQTIQTAIPDMGAVKTGMESTLCMLTDSGMPNRPDGDKCNIPVLGASSLSGEPLDCSDVTAEEKKQISYPNFGTPGILDYEIPFKNTSCKLSQSDHKQKVLLCAVKDRLVTGYNQQAADNFAKYEDAIQNTVGQFMNPLMILALWIEESGASYKTSWAMGCKFMFGSGTPTKGWFGNPGDLASHLSEQMSCVNSFYDNLNAGGFRRFLCQYGDEERDKGYNCTKFTNNPVTPANLKFWYGTFSQILGSSCTIK